VEVGNRIVDEDEALQMSGGYEQLHDPLAPPRRQVDSTPQNKVAIPITMANRYP
jgi:hypothetical protein